ncbi:precorrin-2 C(20)-methyltransferase (S-adenosyl-L-methionine--precorrin-2 methyltransferase) (SP2MT) [Burkholderia multivorans CGD1]|nr:precorrin-2 C(20)-methyltransferase (S-adenosyl-L-methionine--precorrin-2 methyltransferase) (SP2MT) [Burkholderia multivorans CGD1]
MKLGRNFDKVRRVLDERGPARRGLYEARHDRRIGNHVYAPDDRRASARSTGSRGNTR